MRTTPPATGCNRRTMDSALRFERALGFSAESWMRMQITVDMYDALHGRVGKAVDRIKPIVRAS